MLLTQIISQLYAHFLLEELEKHLSWILRFSKFSIYLAIKTQKPIFAMPVQDQAYYFILFSFLFHLYCLQLWPAVLYVVSAVFESFERGCIFSPFDYDRTKHHDIHS
jgi:hypothetical protein